MEFNPDHLFLNSNSFKCSSYIDNRNKLTSLASCKTTLKKETNMKKLKQAISNKLKKIMNINLNNTPDQFELYQSPKSVAKPNKSLRKSLTRSAKKDQVDSKVIQLVNFKYNGSSNFDLDSIEVNKSCARPMRSAYAKRNSIAPAFNIEQNTLRRSRRYSDGQLSSSSSSSSIGSTSTKSSSKDLFDSELLRSKEISHLFSYHVQHSVGTFNCTKPAILLQQQEQTFQSNQIQTSTPLNTNRVRPVCNNTNGTYVNTYVLDEDEEEVELSLDKLSQYSMEMDQSTQAPLDMPVLLESTFDSSSCSNLSDDLIILQTQSRPAPVSARKLNKSPFPVCSIIKSPSMSSKGNSSTSTKLDRSKNWNLLVINKFHEDTNATFSKVPQWAVGHELNLAVVNQQYFNPNGNGVFGLNH